jgi:ribosomal protein L15E
MGDRRFAIRIPRADHVDLYWQDQAGQTQQGVAQLADISRSGACVRAERPLRIGSALSLKYQNEDFPGTVRHCVRRGTGYLLGIEFQPGHRWSPQPRQLGALSPRT